MLEVALHDETLIGAELSAKRFAGSGEFPRGFVETFGGSQVTAYGKRDGDAAFNIELFHEFSCDGADWCLKEMSPPGLLRRTRRGYDQKMQSDFQNAVISSVCREAV